MMPVNLINEKDLNNYLTDIVYHGQELETFSSGDFKSVAFVEQNKNAIIRSMMLQWCKHRLRSYLAEDLPEHKNFLIPVKANEPELPAWAERNLADGKPVYRFEAEKVPPRLTENIGMVRDYLYSVSESYINKTLARVKNANADGKEEISPKLRIDYLKTQEIYGTFTKTLEEAKNWHKIMAEKAEEREHNEELYKASLSGTKVVTKLSDGMEIVQLTTPEALDYESEYMGHCVGDGGYDDDVKKGNLKIYSLRDADGRPHATFEVRVNKKGKEEIHQCKGKGNEAPVEKYKPYVQEFVNLKDFDIVGDCENIGLVRLYDEETKTSKYYDIFNIPKGKKFVCKGDLDLSNSDLTELPDLSNVFVRGDFNCSGNYLTSLKGAPQKISGSFCCSDNQLTSLEYAPEIGCKFNYNNELMSVDDGLKRLRASFDCSNNQLTSLEHGPQEVWSFDCSNNNLTSLEHAPKKVRYNFNCSHNQLTSLKHLPQEALNYYCFANQLTSLEYSPQKVSGEFSCASNKLTSLEHAPKKVRYNFDCSRNRLTSLQYAPQDVGGTFDCSNNQLTSLQYAPRKIGSFSLFCKEESTFWCSANPLTTLSDIPVCDKIIADTDLMKKYGFDKMICSYEKLVNSNLYLLEKTRKKVSKASQASEEKTIESNNSSVRKSFKTKFKALLNKILLRE